MNDSRSSQRSTQRIALAGLLSLVSCGCAESTLLEPPIDAAELADGGPMDLAIDAAALADAGPMDLAPRPIAPLSTSTVTSQQPTLRWELPTGADGARVELCRDRACTDVIATLDVTGTITRPSNALPSGVVFWRLHARSGETTSAATSPTWQFNVGARSAPVDTSWGTTLDVNGDGYADVVVGDQPNSSSLATLHLYFGGASGLATTASWIQTGAAVGDWFGTTLSTAGDVNGDGYADLLVGAPNAASGAGAVYLYLGGATGLGTTAAWMQTGAVSPDSLGSAVTGAGDVNGDGYADVVVTAGNAGVGYAGAAHVYLGSATGLGGTPAQTLPGADGVIAFAQRIASAGDVDGDGYADVAISSGVPMGAVLPPDVNVYRGGPAGLDPTPAWAAPAELFASAGDVNGDGYADLVVGITRMGTSLDGTASVYLGSATGLATTPAWTQPGAARSLFGSGVTCAGDVDADGYADVVVLAPGEGNSLLGVLYLYLGGPSGLSTTATWMRTGDGWGNPIGVGDVDRDGYADLLVGAYWTSALTGSAFVYLGGATGLGATPTWTVTGTANSQFGASIASAATRARRYRA